MGETPSAWYMLLDLSTRYPTAIFTGLVLLCLLYWVALIVGAADIDALDFGGDSPSAESASGLLMKFGLADLPNTVVVSAIAVVGWLVSFWLCASLIRVIPGGAVGFLINTAILLGTLPLAARLAGWLLSPVRPLFMQMNREHRFEVIGRSAVVRTGEVTPSFGEATVEDGGAGLILKVRSFPAEHFSHGDRVVVVERLEDGAYRVVAETELTAP